MPTTFHQRKRKALADWPPAGIDPGVREVCEQINRHRGVWTTQSCEGHVETVDEETKRVRSGMLWLHFIRALRRRHATLATALLRAKVGVEQAGLLYGREPWPTFEIVFKPGYAVSVGEVVTRWLDEQGFGMEPPIGVLRWAAGTGKEGAAALSAMAAADHGTTDEKVARLYQDDDESTEIAREIRVVLRPRALGWSVSEGDRSTGPLAPDEALATFAAVLLDDQGRGHLAARMKTFDEHRAERERRDRRIAGRRAERVAATPPRTIDVVFDGPPSHESGRFVEVEDDTGKGIRIGQWIDRGNGLWALRIPINYRDEPPSHVIAQAARELDRAAEVIRRHVVAPDVAADSLASAFAETASRLREGREKLPRVRGDAQTTHLTVARLLDLLVEDARAEVAARMEGCKPWERRRWAIALIQARIAEADELLTMLRLHGIVELDTVEKIMPTTLVTPESVAEAWDRVEKRVYEGMVAAQRSRDDATAAAGGSDAAEHPAVVDAKEALDEAARLFDRMTGNPAVVDRLLDCLADDVESDAASDLPRCSKKDRRRWAIAMMRAKIADNDSAVETLREAGPNAVEMVETCLPPSLISTSTIEAAWDRRAAARRREDSSDA
ncbi:MAG TPA: hypothetical protein DCY40_07555 [Actinobacteria bacterium]|nr:hypothetical protein [Actinomycetota bacterium]